MIEQRACKPALACLGFAFPSLTPLTAPPTPQNQQSQILGGWEISSYLTILWESWGRVETDTDTPFLASSNGIYPPPQSEPLCRVIPSVLQGLYGIFPLAWPETVCLSLRPQLVTVTGQSMHRDTGTEREPSCLPQPSPTRDSSWRPAGLPTTAPQDECPIWSTGAFVLWDLQAAYRNSSLQDGVLWECGAVTRKQPSK